MTERTLLIVEDDPQTLESWQRDIREFNRNSGAPFQWVPEAARTKVEALKILERISIDAAVIDLRIPVGGEGQPEDASGNEVLESIFSEIGIPTVVHSGHIQEVEDKFGTSAILMLNKGNGSGMQALNWLAEHEGLMSAMRAARKSIASETGRMFSQSIWPRWSNTWKDMPDADVLSGVITRQLVNHVAEQLSLPPNQHHPEEFYIVPPLSAERLATGDLLTIDDKDYVVVTPRCNISRTSYPKHFLLAQCERIGGGLWSELGGSLSNGSADKRRRAEDRLKSLANQGFEISQHFLPPCGDKGPWLVSFKDVIAFPSENSEDLRLTRFAAIATPFIPNLVQRYAAYMGRIGQPDLDVEVLKQHALG